MKLLDLFCGAGMAADGYVQAGFDVTGVDNRPQPNYPCQFMQGNALDVLQDRGSCRSLTSSMPARHASSTPVPSICAMHRVARVSTTICLPHAYSCFASAACLGWLRMCRVPQAWRGRSSNAVRPMG